MNAFRQFNSRWHAPQLSGLELESMASILDTPPIAPRRDGVALIATVGTSNLLPALVAIKSFLAHLGRGRPVLFDDGTLTAADRAVLAHHCADPELVRIGEIAKIDFPEGDAWAPLLSILDRRSAEYCIRIDTDSVTLGNLPEVEQAIAANRSFALIDDGASEEAATPQSFASFVATTYPDGADDRTLRTSIESRLDRLNFEGDWRYLSGPASLSGFCAGGHGRKLAASFLHALEKLLGPERTASSGCVRATSNLLIANDASPVILPQDRYRDGERVGHDGEPCFQRFAQPNFEHALYADAVQKAVAYLQDRGR